MAYLSRSEREQQIIEGAIRFFSEQGLSGQTRELSASLGIAQPLLYRYFPSKQALIHRIFIEAFQNRWNDQWKVMILDGSAPIGSRFKQFYQEFDRSILTREWVRLFVYSELEGYGYSRKVLAKLKSDIFVPLCLALRQHYGFNGLQDTPVTKQEVEMILQLHGVILYNAIRKHVYGLKISVTTDRVLDNLLFYLEGAAPQLLSTLFDTKAKSNGSLNGVTKLSAA